MICLCRLVAISIASRYNGFSAHNQMPLGLQKMSSVNSTLHCWSGTFKTTRQSRVLFKRGSMMQLDIMDHSILEEIGSLGIWEFFSK